MKRFWAKVNKNSGIFGATGLYPTECWVWTGFIAHDGYGETSYKSKTIKSHRLAWILQVGAPPTQCVLHKCDYRPCIRGDHLFEGTRKENCADMRSKNRYVIPVGSHNGKSKLTEQQVEQIRLLYATGEYTHRSLGKLFAVNHSTIGFVLRREAWRHVK